MTETGGNRPLAHARGYKKILRKAQAMLPWAHRPPAGKRKNAGGPRRRSQPTEVASDGISCPNRFTMRIRYLLLALAAALFVVPCTRAAAPRPPNIIFFLVDDWGWTDAACFGSKLYETPNIDRLATQGM